MRRTILLGLVLVCLRGTGELRASAQSQTIAPHQSIDRSIQPGEEQQYSVVLAPGQAARFELVTDAALLMTLVRPDGTISALIPDASGQNATQPATVVAQDAGVHAIVMRIRDGGTRGGAYRLILAGVHPVTDADVQQIRAERLLREGLAFAAKTSQESRLAAVDRFRESAALSRSTGDRSLEVNAVSMIGQMFNRLGEARKAIESYEIARTIFHDLGNPRQEASMLNNLGLEYRNIAEYAQAIDALTRSAAMFHEQGEKAGERSPHNNLALTLYDLGELGKAQTEYQTALALARETSDRSGEAFALAGVAGVANADGRMQTAIDTYESAIAIWRDLGNFQLEAQMLGNLGQIHLKLGDRQAALEYMLQAQETQKLAPSHRLEAVTLRNLATAYTRLDQPQKALPLINRSLEFWRELDNRAEESDTTSRLAEILFASRQPAEAAEAYERARTLAHDAGNPSAEILALTGQSRVRLKQGRDAEALDRATDALMLARRSSLTLSEEQALVSLGRVEAARNDMVAARGHFEDAIALGESVRRSVAGPDLRTSFFTDVREQYDLLIGVLMRLHQSRPSEGFDARALECSERARARGLLELLGESRANIREGIAPGLLERERTVRSILAGHKNAPDSTVATALKDYRDLQNEIRARSPRYASLVEPQPANVADIRQELLDDRTALIEYALGEERSYVWVVTRSALTSRTLPPRARIEAAARKAYDTLTDPAAPGRREALHALSRLLLDPIADRLGSERLAVVAEGSLQYIPFAALPDAAGRPLVATHELVSLPSASTLQMLRRELAGRAPAPRALFVLGDPVFDDRDPRVRPAGPVARRTASTVVERSARDSGTASLDRLYLTRREAEDIASLVRDESARPVLDFDANLDRVTDGSLSSYRVVHFATHGLLNNRHPELSGLVFSLVDARGTPRNGFLPAYDVYNLRLNADLVVLSACQTALGEDIRGEGIVGLTRGFMYAGAARVVSSLWRVPDNATAALMRHLYRGMLVDHLPPAAALRSAQRAIRAEPRWSAPYYWAGFVIQGEWR